MADLSDLEKRIRVMEDTEAIKKLKAKYFRCVDKKLWDEMEEVWVEDAVADYGMGIELLQGIKAIMEFLKKNLGGDSMISVHQGHNPEIEITSDTTARGVWVLNDRLIIQTIATLNGWRYYEDEYVKVNGEWKKKSTKITNILEEWTQTKT
ncbi:MAG: nuclear transport factor 2 family protein [Dehalococcoidia bacterium]|jgi:bile-acid 7alpha-dehydratase|nr:nuclear transport factor 2 family protein [Dehalococcoidia bacterium]